MVWLRKIFFLIIICADAFASARYNLGQLGQKDFDVYSGHDWPLFEYDEYTNNVIWNDDKIQKYYVQKLWGKGTIKLQDFFENHLYQSMNCPHEQMSNSFEYLRYVNRILAVSYIYESIREYELIAKKLGLKLKDCSVNWKELFSQCRPKTIYMKSFLNNVGVVLDQTPKVFVSSDLSRSSFKSTWLNNYANGNFQDISHYRIDQYCEDNFCTSKSRLNLLSSFSAICKNDLNDIKKICNEKDHLYGLYSVPEQYQLLQGSGILNRINKDGFAKGCLRRFVIQMRRKEVVPSYLKKIFPIIYSNFLENSNIAYKEGKIFAAGQLVEFADKGLENIFELEKVVTAPSIAKVEEKKEKEIKKIIKTKIKKIPPIKIVKKIIKQPKKKIEKSPWKSNFLITAQFRQKYDLKIAKVDMLKFKYDYFFNLKVSKLMDKALASYMKLDALEEMKRLDKLGTLNAPVPLVFIKYMIDKNHHQGLFNLMTILGSEFYVKNNIDSKLGFAYDFIELRNDKSTNFLWQIFIKRAPKN